MQKTEFVVAKDGFLDGVHRVAGETLALTPRQAEHLLISGQIARPAEPAPAPAPAPAPEDAPAKGKK